MFKVMRRRNNLQLQRIKAANFLGINNNSIFEKMHEAPLKYKHLDVIAVEISKMVHTEAILGDFIFILIFSLVLVF